MRKRTTTKLFLASLICAVGVVSAADERRTTDGNGVGTSRTTIPQPDKFVDCGPMDATDYGVESATRDGTITSTCSQSVTQVPSPCSGGDQINWGPGNNCAAVSSAAGHGQSQSFFSTNPRYSGSAQFQCINGSFYPTGANQTCVYVPQPCPSETRTWSQAGVQCSANVASVNHSQTRNVTNTAVNRAGTATFRCADGNFVEESSACTRTDNPCGPRQFTWAQGGASCSFNYTGTANHNDQFTLTVPQGQPTVGSITQRCVNGSYQQVGGATCQQALQDAVCRTHSQAGGYDQSPATSLATACTAGGSFATLTDDTNNWRWRCNGVGGGANANCSAPKSQQNGQCRPYPGTYGSQPGTNTNNACIAGSYSNLANTQTDWRWQCIGTSGGSTAQCSASITPVTPVCRAHPGQHTTQPANTTATGCTSGTYANLTDSNNAWRWRCVGTAGPQPVDCEAQKPTVAGQCRPYPDSYQTTPATSLATACNAGSSFTTLAADQTNHRWVCNGQNGGANSPTCTAERDIVNGRCTVVTGAQTTDPSSCDAGTVANRFSNANQWGWSCQGSGGGTNSSCTAVRFNQAACGTEDGRTGSTPTAQPVAGNRCASGNTVSNYLSDLDKFTWSCSTPTSTIHLCRFNRPRTNGTCGSNNGSSPGEGPPLDFRPTTNLCSAGILEFDGEGGNWRYGADDLTAADGTWNWVCQGTAGGSNQFCSRAKAQPQTGQCGTADDKSYPSSQTSYSPDSQCAVGSPSSTFFPAAGGSRSWTCSGVNGGASSGTCTASRQAAGVPGQCGNANNHTFTSDATTWSPRVQCDVGSPSNSTFPAPGGTRTWTCSGTNGASASVTCSATRDAAQEVSGCPAQRLHFQNPMGETCRVNFPAMGDGDRRTETSIMAKPFDGLRYQSSVVTTRATALCNSGSLTIVTSGVLPDNAASCSTRTIYVGHPSNWDHGVATAKGGAESIGNPNRFNFYGRDQGKGMTSRRDLRIGHVAALDYQVDGQFGGGDSGKLVLKALVGAPNGYFPHNDGSSFDPQMPDTPAVGLFSDRFAISLSQGSDTGPNELPIVSVKELPGTYNRFDYRVTITNNVTGSNRQDIVGRPIMGNVTSSNRFPVRVFGRSQEQAGGQRFAQDTQVVNPAGDRFAFWTSAFHGNNRVGTIFSLIEEIDHLLTAMTPGAENSAVPDPNYTYLTPAFITSSARANAEPGALSCGVGTPSPLVTRSAGRGGTIAVPYLYGSGIQLSGGEGRTPIRDVCPVGRLTNVQPEVPARPATQRPFTPATPREPATWRCEKSTPTGTQVLNCTR